MNTNEKCNVGVAVIELFESHQIPCDEMIDILVNVLVGISAAYVSDLTGFWKDIGSEGLNRSIELKEQTA